MLVNGGEGQWGDGTLEAECPSGKRAPRPRPQARLLDRLFRSGEAELGQRRPCWSPADRASRLGLSSASLPTAGGWPCWRRLPPRFPATSPDRNPGSACGVPPCCEPSSRTRARLRGREGAGGRRGPAVLPPALQRLPACGDPHRAEAMFWKQLWGAGQCPWAGQWVLGFRRLPTGREARGPGVRSAHVRGGDQRPAVFLTTTGVPSQTSPRPRRSPRCPAGVGSPQAWGHWF